MRYLFGFLCVCALGLMPLVGCETADNGGTGGMPECQNPEDCDDDDECTEDACTDGMCVYTGCEPAAVCMQGVCVYEGCEGLEDGLRCFRFGGSPGICADGSCEIACVDEQCEDDENVCTHDGTCNTDNGACDYPPVEDGTLCPSGLCVAGVCDVEF